MALPPPESDAGHVEGKNGGTAIAIAASRSGPLAFPADMSREDPEGSKLALLT